MTDISNSDLIKLISLIKGAESDNMGKCKIVAIQGSYRENGLTTSMLKYAVDKANRIGHEVTYLNLFEKKIDFCKGCRKCLETEECVFKNDDMPEVTRLIKNADVIILAAPVYWANTSAIVKNLFDRLLGASMMETKTFPKPRLAGKRYIFFTACNTRMPFAKWVGQSTGIIRAVREYFKTSGIRCIGTVICDNTGINTEVSEHKIKKINKLLERI